MKLGAKIFIDQYPNTGEFIAAVQRLFEDGWSKVDVYNGREFVFVFISPKAMETKLKELL